jgi:uncharacterized protein (TIGR02996 family)
MKMARHGPPWRKETAATKLTVGIHQRHRNGVLAASQRSPYPGLCRQQKLALAPSLALRMKSTPDPTREALSRAIVADPDDDTPRLVFADLLDETGDPLPKPGRAAGGPRHVSTGPNAAHAELIRLQCRLATMNVWDEGYTEATVRCRRLVAEHPEWVEPLGDSYIAYQYSPPEFGQPLVRGFPEHLCAAPQDLLPVWDGLFRRLPIRTVEFRLWNEYAERDSSLKSRPALNKLLSRPECARIRRLAIQQPDDGHPNLPVPVGANPHLRGLKELSYSGDLRGAEIQALVESPVLAGLEAFTYYGHMYGDDDAARAVGRYSWFPNLRSLSLLGGFFKVAAIKNFYRDADFFTGLTGLRLSGHEVAPAEHFPDLFASGKLAGLRTLELGMLQFGEEAFRRMAKAAGPRDLALLSLKSRIPNPTVPGGPASVATLFAAPWLAGLRSCHLTSAGVCDHDITTLARPPYSATLRVLELVDGSITEAGLRALLSARGGWPCLARLNLMKNRIPDEALTRLVDHPALARVVSLAVGDRTATFAPRFLTRLAESPASARFRELDLNVCLDDTSADALWKSSHLEHLDVFHVRKGKAGRTAWNRLLRRFGPRLIPK